MSTSPPPKRQKISSSSQKHSFAIDPLTSYAGPCAIIKQPVEITCFSYDKDRNLHHDTSSMKYYYPPRIGEDLETGFDQFRKHEEVDEHLDSLLESLMRYEQDKGKNVDVDIVTWRGMLTKIMTTPFERNEGWSMNAIRFENTMYADPFPIYLTRTQLVDGGNGRYIEEEKDFEARRAKDRNHELAMFAGYKFESLCTLDKTWDESTREEIENRNQNVVDNIQQYCSVVRTQLGSSAIIMGGEVDCLWDYKPDPPENPVPHYMELKTTKELTSPRSIQSFEQHKLLKFWAQSFLLGVPKIIVGFRSNRQSNDTNQYGNSGYGGGTGLGSIQMLETMKIPAQIQGRGAGMWDGNVCINFTAKFLEFLREIVTEDLEGEEGVWSIRFAKGGREVSVFKKEGKSFLTEEYVSWKQNNQ